jgi:hypothetical protein
MTALKYHELPNWTMEIDEVSAGVYRVIATDAVGHRFQSQGTDPDALLNDARRAARELEDKMR